MTTEPLARLVRTFRDTLDADAETDAALLARLRVGRDPAAAEAVVRRHGPRVLAACRKVLGADAEAEDAFQATFLVLLRNPAAVRRQASLGAWLYGVAHRIALQARARRIRRAGPPAADVPAPPDLPWREACAVLHEELDRLPDTTRLPLVLCYLDGLSRDEAAAQLGRTLNSVKKSLEKGRESLRKRLSKRGVTLSAGLLAAVAEPVVADPPPILAASMLAAIRPAAAALAKSIQTRARLRLAGVGLAVSVLAVGVALGFPTAPKGASPPPKEMPAKPVAKKETPTDEGPMGERIAFSGRVVDPDGKAVKGARLFLVNRHEMPDDRPDLKSATTSAADGRFHFAIDRPPKRHDFRRTLVAAADGFGLGLLPVNESGVADADVRLFPDVPVQGRILDLQGKPVSGATVRVADVGGLPTADLSEWVKESEGPGLTLVMEWILDKLPQRVSLRFRSIPALAPAVSDKDGRFTLKGIGRDRVAALSVVGPGVATSQVIVVTRPGPAGQLKLLAGGETLRHPFYRLPFDHVVTPEQPLEGRVTDRETGEPIAGVKLQTSTVRSGDLTSTTGKDGHFRFDGLPPGSFHFDLQPGAGTPYHRQTVFGGKRDSIQPARLDVALPRAPWVTGKVIDERTRRPIAGAWVRYLPGRDNPRAREYQEKLRAIDVVTLTGPDGKFRLPGIPGAGWLNVGHDRGYVPAVERPLQGDTIERIVPHQIPTTTGGLGTSGNALVAVDVDPKASKEYTITLDPGVTVPVALTDPDGKPVTGVLILGVEAHWQQWSKPFARDTLEVPAFNPDQPRTLFFYQPDRNLGLLFHPRKGDAGPWSVKLQPTATVTGKLVLPDGKPYPNVSLGLSFAYAKSPGWASPPEGLPEARTKTDADGRFTFTKIIGDVDYSFWYPVFQDKFNQTTKVPFRAKPGETLDLGTITSKPPNK